MVQITLTILLLLLGSLANVELSGAETSLNVLDFGAVGDGKTDDSPAFLRAWKEACSSSSSDVSILTIPPNKSFLLKPVTFSGPCKPNYVYIQLQGTIVAPNSTAEWSNNRSDRWLAFSYVDGLVLRGSGTIDGQGSVWWSCASYEHGGPTCRGPAALTFYRCKRVVLKGLRHINSPRTHIILTSCKYVTISDIHISAPGTSPNTDGINVSGSSDVDIRDSFIGTGDDCVAISGGSFNVDINGVFCGPGHGLSIGSLDGNDTVENVNVQNCILKGTLTGVRIKTWQGGFGRARYISFKKIKFIRANNPIIIDQFYCPHQDGCKNETSAIRVSDVSYSQIHGSSITDKVINLSCDQHFGCYNITFSHVYISSKVPGKKAYSYCFNAHGTSQHTKPNVTCLLD